MNLSRTDTKVDESIVREYHSLHLRNSSATDIAIAIDDLKIFQSILSRQLPPERYDGLINLIYVLRYPNATSAEIEGSLVMCANQLSLTVFFFLNLARHKNNQLSIDMFRIICTELIPRRQKHRSSQNFRF